VREGFSRVEVKRCRGVDEGRFWPCRGEDVERIRDGECCYRKVGGRC
jgi:hypothetical protein